MATEQTLNDKALMSLAQDAIRTATLDPATGVLHFPNDVHTEIVSLPDLQRLPLLARVHSDQVQRGNARMHHCAVFFQSMAPPLVDLLYPCMACIVAQATGTVHPHGRDAELDESFIPDFLRKRASEPPERVVPDYAHRAIRAIAQRDLWLGFAGAVLLLVALRYLSIWSTGR